MLQTFTMQIQQHGKQNVVVMGMGGNTSEPLSSSSVHGSKMTSWGYVYTTAGAEGGRVGPQTEFTVSLQTRSSSACADSANCRLCRIVVFRIEKHPPVSGPCCSNPGCWKVNCICIREVRETVIKAYMQYDPNCELSWVGSRTDKKRNLWFSLMNCMKFLQCFYN